MAKWVSFKEVRSQVGIAQILKRYGLLEDATTRGSELRLPLPVPRRHDAVVYGKHGEERVPLLWLRRVREYIRSRSYERGD